MMEEAFRLIDDPAGESTYLRLSTRNIQQVERDDDSWREGALAGGYWLREPGANAEAAIVAMGAVMPEALAAWEELSERHSGPRPARRHVARPASPRLDRRAGRALEGRAQAEPRRATAVAALARTPASSRSPTPRPHRCPGSAACSASASRRSASRSSARPAASPNSMPPTGSTATRSPRRLPSYCSPA